jgi:radical SAM superfamily enzyme YgiQ (UPF0313 family)
MKDLLWSQKYHKVYIEVKYPIAQEIYDLNIQNAVYYGDVENDPIDYNTLPFDINRELTRWRLYAYKNGNFRRTPGTYIQSAQDCWYGKCTFCNWASKFPNCRTREVEEVIGEIEYLVRQYGIKEIMDDSGTFPTGKWLKEFCGYKKYTSEITLNCNMRFGILGLKEYKMMKEAGFRMLLFGVESFNQTTLDRLKKGIKCQEIIDGCRLASKAGLEPHLTVMYGYPWESKNDAEHTMKTVQWLLCQGLASSVQSTLVIPYPNTPLYQESLKNGWLLTQDLNKYNMSQPVLKCEYDPLEYVRRTYEIAYSPKFLWNKFKKIRNIDDIKYYWRTAKKVRGHIK